MLELQSVAATEHVVHQLCSFSFSFFASLHIKTSCFFLSTKNVLLALAISRESSAARYMFWKKEEKMLGRHSTWNLGEQIRNLFFGWVQVFQEFIIRLSCWWGFFGVSSFISHTQSSCFFISTIETISSTIAYFSTRNSALNFSDFVRPFFC